MSKARRISSERRSEISDLAEFIADEYCPSARVEPEAILRAKDLTLSFGPYGDTFDGMLECRNARFHVYCNLDRVERRGSTRGRFTLGHELGHYFIDEHRNALLAGVDPHGSLCEYESRNPVEQEADLFSSSLLLPRRRFLAAAKGVSKGLAGILNLAGLFDTSLCSTAIRYVQEDLVPCTVIKRNPEGFGWKWFSPETYRAGFRKTIESRDQLPADSATERVFSGEEPSGERFLRCGSTAATWFPFLTAGSTRNVILIEEAVSLGRYGVLTFLYPERGSYDSAW